MLKTIKQFFCKHEQKIYFGDLFDIVYCKKCHKTLLQINHIIKDGKLIIKQKDDQQTGAI